MASLGSIFMGSAIGQGAANFVREGARARFDEQRFDRAAAEMEQAQKERDYRNDVIARERQAWDIDSSVQQGDTDEAKLQWLADKAAKVGRGDLQRKYLGEATKAAQARKNRAIAAAAVATVQGDPKAVSLWNQSGLYEGSTLVGVQPKMAADGRRDPSGDFIFSVKDPESGQVLPLEVPAGLMALGAAEPEQIPLILERFQKTRTTAGIQQQQANTQQQNADTRALALLERTRANKAMEAWRQFKTRGGGGTGGQGGGGKLPNEQWRYNWAKTMIGPSEIFESELEARQWAADPNWANKADLALRLKLAGESFFPQGKTEKVIDTAEDLGKDIVKPGGRGKGGGNTPPKLGEPPKGEANMATLGKNPRFPKAVWSEADKGWFQKKDGQVMRVE